MTHRTALLLALLGLSMTVALTGCPTSGDDDDSSGGDDDDSGPVDFAIWSPDFVEPYFDVPSNRECEDGALPVAFSCENPNPQIRWEGVPEGAVGLALIFDDPTAGGFDHWAIFNIDPTETGLGQSISGRDITNTPPGDSIELDNGFGWNGYLGSCPGGVNRYSWRLYAVSEELDSTISSYGALQVAAEAAAIETVEMCHVFDGAEI